MKRLVITNDCDGASLEAIKEAHTRFACDYRLPFSDSCWVFSRGVSLLDVELESGRRIVTRKEPDFSFLKGLIKSGRIDVLHTWGDFPRGGFSRDLVAEGFRFLESDQIRFLAWTAHGGKNDRQNLAPLGEGDVEGSHYYHMDYTRRLGIDFFSRSTDIVVGRPPPRIVEDVIYFKRFRGPPKHEVRSITLDTLPKQIELSEKRSIWHRPADGVIIYTHFYAEEDRLSPQGWKPVENFRVPKAADDVLRKLADRRDRGEIDVLSLGELLGRKCTVS